MSCRRSSTACAARPSSSTTTRNKAYRLSRVLRPPQGRPAGQPGLPPGRRQAVALFHVADISVLQVRMDSVGDERKRAQDVIAPAQPSALADRGPKCLRGDEPAAARPAQPREGVVEAGTELSEVEHRLLDPGPRGSTGRVPHSVDPIAAVDDDRRGQRVPFLPGDPDATVMADGHVDDRTRAVSQSVELACRVMTEGSSRASAQHARPQQALARRGFPYTPHRRLGRGGTSGHTAASGRWWPD
jgi:hypothetical protein